MSAFGQKAERLTVTTLVWIISKKPIEASIPVRALWQVAVACRRSRRNTTLSAGPLLGKRVNQQGKADGKDLQVRKGSSFGCNRYPPLSPSRGAVSAGKGARNGTGAQSLHARRVQAVQRVHPEPRTDNRLPSAEREHSQSGLPPTDGWRCATVTTRRQKIPAPSAAASR
jgi:hypothetical protein